MLLAFSIRWYSISRFPSNLPFPRPRLPEVRAPKVCYGEKEDPLCRSAQHSNEYPLTIKIMTELTRKKMMLSRGDCARERIQDEGQWVPGRSRGIIGQGWEQKAHFLPLAMPDEARQPDAVTEVLQLDRHLGPRTNGRNFVARKFHEHALRTEIEHTALTHRALPTTNGHRKHLVGVDGHPSNRSSIPLGDG